MSAIADTVFSEYEVRQMNVIVADKQVGTIKGIGSLEEEAEVKIVVKKCRGTVAKTRTRGTGAGTHKVTMHIPLAIYNKNLNMDQSEVAEVEAEIAVNPDEHGNGIYEALATELEPVLAQKWMEQFTPADAQASVAYGRRLRRPPALARRARRPPRSRRRPRP